MLGRSSAAPKASILPATAASRSPLADDIAGHTNQSIVYRIATPRHEPQLLFQST